MMILLVFFGQTLFINFYYIFLGTFAIENQNNEQQIVYIQKCNSTFHLEFGNSLENCEKIVDKHIFNFQEPTGYKLYLSVKTGVNGTTYYSAMQNIVLQKRVTFCSSFFSF